MRLQDQQISVQTGGELSGGNFGISDGDQAHILVILRDKLYSDKLMAVLREYGTNALDAHVESGQATRPIKIELPTRFSPTLTIRDYGAGLTEDQIYNVYTQYGRSTKRDSDDVIGQLGLGCKSAFAYSQQFTVTSWCGGRKLVFNAYIDPTNVGRMTKLIDEASAESETGVEVSIPVRNDDIDQFQHRAQRCYYYFEPKPTINMQMRVPEYAIQRGWWRVKTQFDQDQNTPVGVMGSIGYPLRKERMGKLTPDEEALLQLPLEIRFQLGELSISANREDLEYTPHSINNIKNRLHAVIKQLSDEASAKFAAATTAWEARQLYWQYKSVAGSGIQSNGYRHGQSQNFISQLVDRFSIWKGVKLATTDWHQAGITGVPSGTIKGLGAGDTRFRTTTYAQNYIAVYKDTVMYVADSKSSYMQRILQNRKTHALVYTPSKPGAVVQSDIDDFMTKYGLTGMSVIKTDSLAFDPKLVVGTGGTADRSKQNISVFELVSNWDPNRHPKSNNWTAVEVDQADGKGVYVALFNYYAEDAAQANISLHDIHRQQQTLKLLGGPTYKIEPLVGVKRKDAADMGKGWETWDKYYAREFERLLVASGILGDVADFRTLTESEGFINQICNVKDQRCEQLARAVPGTRFAQIVDSAVKSKRRLQAIRAQSNIKLLQQMVLDTTVSGRLSGSGFSLKTEEELLATKYPLLRRTQFLTCYSPPPEFVTEIQQYIKALDASQP